MIAVHAGFGCLYFTERSQIIPGVEMAQDLELRRQYGYAGPSGTAKKYTINR